MTAPSPQQPILSVRDLTFRYPGSDVPVLDKVSFDVSPGEFVAVVGPSGSGKSTLLGAVSGLRRVTDGAVELRGERVTGPHSDIGVVMQEDTTFPWRDVLRNIEFGLEMRGVPKAVRQTKARDMLALIGLQAWERHHPDQLSGGMRQRVAIARTLVLEPALLLMDEPFGALDEQTRILLGDELLRVQAELGQTILFITHNLQEAVLLSDRVIVLGSRPGRILDCVETGFGRPRDSSLISTPRFAELLGRIWGLLRQEASKDFASPAAASVSTTAPTAPRTTSER